MSLVYAEKIPASTRTAFTSKVEQIASYLGTNPNWLMQLMKAESGINPQARNIQNNRIIATGLIQFTEATAKGLGTTMNALYGMDRIKQLDYVKAYYTPYRNRLNSYFDVYLATFFPAAIGKPDDYVFQTSGLSASLIAQQNPAINRNKDSKITMGEFKEYVKSTVPNSIQGIIFGSSLLTIFIPLIFILAIYFLIK
jgi:hypothetical protein